MFTAFPATPVSVGRQVRAFERLCVNAGLDPESFDLDLINEKISERGFSAHAMTQLFGHSA